jgi:hypothetical protein
VLLLLSLGGRGVAIITGALAFALFLVSLLLATGGAVIPAVAATAGLRFGSRAQANSRQKRHPSRTQRLNGATPADTAGQGPEGVVERTVLAHAPQARESPATAKRSRQT